MTRTAPVNARTDTVRREAMQKQAAFPETRTTLLQLAAGPIAHAALSVTALRSVGVVLGLITTLLLTRTIGVGDFGVFAYGLSAAATLSMIARLGLPQIVTRAAAAGAASGALQEVRAAGVFGAMTAVATSVLLSTGAAVFFSESETIQNAALARAGLAGALIAPLITLNVVSQSLLRGMMKPLRAFAPNFVIAPGGGLCGCLVLLALDRLTPITALWAFGAAWVGASLFGWLWALRAWRNAAQGGGDNEANRTTSASLTPVLGRRWREWGGGTLLLSAIGLVELTFGAADMLLLAGVAGPAEIGLYALALRFAAPTAFPGSGVAAGLGPSIARFHATGDLSAVRQRLRRGVRASSAATLAASGFVLAAVYGAAPFLGAPKAELGCLTGILAGGFVAKAAAGAPYEALVMTGHQRAAAIASVIAGVVGSVLLFMLIKMFSATGAALGAAAALVLRDWMMAAFLTAQTGLRSDIFALGD